MHSSLIVFNKKNSLVSEAYKAIRTNILFSSEASLPSVILVTSTQPGEGKTTTACNLSLAFSQSGHKTIIIDADMRKPTLHKIFELKNLVGFSTLLDGKSNIDEVKNHIKDSNIDIITSGPKYDDSTELLSSKILGTIFNNLKQEYDIIIIDSPPAGMVSDASILTTISTGILLVIKEGAVSVKQFERVKVQLEYVGGKILGTVLNMVGNSTDINDYYKNYYYTEYYTDSKMKKKESFLKRFLNKKSK